MLDQVKNKLPQLTALFKSHRVEHAAIFGSAVTPAAFDAKSDIDILVTFNKDIALLDYADNYFSLKEKLEDLLQREVDLVSSHALKNPVLIDSINNSKVTLYAA